MLQAISPPADGWRPASRGGLGAARTSVTFILFFYGRAPLVATEGWFLPCFVLRPLEGDRHAGALGNERKGLANTVARHWTVKLTIRGRVARDAYGDLDDGA